MKKIGILLLLVVALGASKASGQILPSSYQAIINEIVANFETIRGATSITKGSTTFGVMSADKVSLKMTHKKQVKNLTFVTELDEENKTRWVAANQLTIDMVNKYQDDVTSELEAMLKLSEKRSQE